MFVTTEQVKTLTGSTVDQQVVTMSQLMIETYVGKSEAQVTNADDLNTLARATALQAAYIGDSGNVLLEQASVKSIVANETTTVFDLDALAPHYSKYAILACRRLSWMGSRSVKVGATFSVPATVASWETD